MEEVLPLSLVATKGSIETLISLCSTLVEEQRKKTQSRSQGAWEGSRVGQGAAFPEEGVSGCWVSRASSLHSTISLGGAGWAVLRDRPWEMLRSVPTGAAYSAGFVWIPGNKT